MEKKGFPHIAHGLLRIAAGFMYWSHGAQKLLGWFGGFGPDDGTAPLASEFGIAGIIEFFGGLLIMLGGFTQPVAFLCSGEMAVAYFWKHLPRGFFPWQNGGETVALYAFIFLFIAAAGAGAFSIDAWRSRRSAASQD